MIVVHFPLVPAPPRTAQSRWDQRMEGAALRRITASAAAERRRLVARLNRRDALAKLQARWSACLAWLRKRPRPGFGIR